MLEFMFYGGRPTATVPLITSDRTVLSHVSKAMTKYTHWRVSCLAAASQTEPELMNENQMSLSESATAMRMNDERIQLRVFYLSMHKHMHWSINCLSS